jgi:prolycopene isomerase
MPKKYDYDAIIIGAGISGLVCGCYLAKAGMKTLIVEKNAKPGGYCTSFTRGGFTFDACVHSLGSLREDGNFQTILHELDLKERLKIRRHNPSDIIISPNLRIHFWNNIDDTIQEFQNKFPKEAKNIKRFFVYIKNIKGMSFFQLRSITFDVLLEKYFSDNRLKAILSLPLLGNAGLPAKKVSAVIGVNIYKEFMFDGGYYPSGSIQALPDLLVKCYKEFGGKMYFSCSAKKINVKNKKIEGVKIEKKDPFSAKYVISNADATQTYMSLIERDLLSGKMMSLIKGLTPSLSAFVIYLGLNGKPHTMPKDSVMWYMPDFDIDKIYNLTVKGEIEKLDWFLARLSSTNNSIIMVVNVPFKSETYWTANKRKLIDRFIKKMESAFPGLSSNIVYKDAATPHTLSKKTSNYKGAAYGWARTPSQFAVKRFTQTTPIKNLYLTGHWTTLFQGVGGVAYLGRDTSLKILKKENAL